MKQIEILLRDRNENKIIRQNVDCKNICLHTKLSKLDIIFLDFTDVKNINGNLKLMKSISYYLNKIIIM